MNKLTPVVSNAAQSFLFHQLLDPCYCISAGHLELSCKILNHNDLPPLDELNKIADAMFSLLHLTFSFNSN